MWPEVHLPSCPFSADPLLLTANKSAKLSRTFLAMQPLLSFLQNLSAFIRAYTFSTDERFDWPNEAHELTPVTYKSYQ